ncbi:hypothetical protein GE09DRAFT_1190427 [Coniochaeta sp. 2T2.1]|nr:hypothetical protein GE09DRAFT_1190427 [Coniochaeta sp. 2T2.1]
MMYYALASCMRTLTSYGMTVNRAATICFPTSTAMSQPDSDVATSTMLSVWSCLQTASLLCSMDSSCVTAAYAVGQAPTPTPSVGVDLLKDGGFESGSIGGWSKLGFTQNITGEVSTARTTLQGYLRAWTMGTSGNAQFKSTVWIDDITLTRLD